MSRVWSGRWWWLVRLAACELLALALWAFFVNRLLSPWVEGPVKSITFASVGFLLAGLAAVAALSPRTKVPLWPFAAVLAIFGAGEIHRAWLRGRYEADSRSTPLWPIVTTTDLEVRSFRLELAGLGREPLRIVQLTDMHVLHETARAYDELVARSVRELHPDILVFTGDFLSKIERLPALERRLAELPRARLGSYAVLGNHDYWTEKPDLVRSALERAGIEMLSGRCRSVAVPDSVPLSLCGTEAPWGPDYVPENTNPTLVLSHTPDNVYALEQRGAAAVFAGHTHAGQFRVPLAGALLIPSDYGRRFDEGHFRVGRTHLFVSAGVGADAPPLRLWCRPELLVVDLVAQGPR